ncbi:type II secretion system protein GspM [Kordiimonas marina]|uniref:type II secretion system protein GspM n=1 Tax=Kordiimonas marina TaxID=2872312 RepID=UPI001FF2C9AB|nr:type II secretion system protein GspM [Kordiimonas marina]MCJ9430054.1 type II secretion system protein M [Kordiimonas marina]
MIPVDAMLENWRSRPRHEQMILGGLASAVVVVFVFLALFQPAMFYYRDAGRNLAAASYEAGLVHDTVVHALRLLATAAPEPVADAPALTALLNNSAGKAGIVLSRLEARDETTVTVWLDGVEPQRLFDWLSNLKKRHGVAVSVADITAEPGKPTIQAQLQIKV